MQALEWYDLPSTAKYIQFDLLPQRVGSLQSVNMDKTGMSHNGVSPSHSPSLAPYPPSSHSKPFIDSFARSEIQDALKDLEITNQVNRNRRYLSHPKASSAASSILSYTSDSGVGDSMPWGTTATGSRLGTTTNRNVQRFVEVQNQLMTQTPQRDMEAKAAALTLINSSPHPEDLSHRVSLSGRHRLPNHPLSRRNYPGAYSSDDNASFLTVTSESDLFIPRRYPPASYESDEPHHFSRLVSHTCMSL